ncbi:hypothetical protein FRZ67_22355 [Panacibacter ginsenosidivorans]|uniref:Porin n=1 Tax=Panacibacter ginsenosidivorans TaxID=1813871 RepID=A0A5B8VEJ3_9BACT|nr:putative porin [Panacibacter ginsenosidivorans]QEC69904.1 hypothetical protein FRZ67_22355 [Panacibacter ginsenosidivorans]
MLKRRSNYIICFFVAMAACISVHAQNDDLPTRRVDNLGRPINPSRKDSASDKLQHRDAYADSITISYHYFDSTKTYKLDSSVSDFYSRYPVSYNYTDLGNFGNAARSIIFSPYMKPGFDAGFHAYDVYKYKVEDTKIFTTTRPYTELAYLLGSKSEQFIDMLHTQNRNSNLNFSFGFRLINAPGTFKNQNTNHNNIRIAVAYTSKNKRYNNTFIFINNKMQSSDNGGVQDDKALANNESFSDPFRIPTRLGTESQFTRNPFSTKITTGTEYKQNILLFRQQYDLGQKDSLVTDSVTYHLFYPRIRFQHSIEFTRENYLFQDLVPIDSLYLKYYNFNLSSDTVSFRDQWSKLTNEFAVVSFPEKNNQNQFLKLGAGYEMIAGGYYPYKTKYNNVYFTGEYRNRTRNKKWDVVISGRLYSAGSYAGDYEAYASLERLLENNKGNLQLGFQDVNRSQSAIFSNNVTAFPVITNGENFNKENIAKAFAAVNFSKLGLSLVGDYYIVSNYVYMDDFFHAQQESALFNVLHVGAQKKIKLKKNWYWYIEAHFQQTAGNPPVNLPVLLTRQRFAFEGNFFKNLFLSTGFEVRYNTPYDADNYSPFTGQFIYQNDFSTIANRPDINAYFNFRIKSFKGFIRAENINSLNTSDKFKFTRNNFSAPHYPQRPFWFRLGIWWNFVN